MIYFDNSATTAISPQALESYKKVSESLYGNPSSLHDLGEKAASLLKQARQQIADLLNVNSSEIYFTSGGSEGDNWAIKGTVWEKRDFGQHIITSSIEHPAVKETMKHLEREGFDITYLPVDENGRVRPTDVENALRDDTILVSVMAVNNEIGALQPIQEIAEILEKYPKIHFHVDAVQAVGRLGSGALDLKKIDLAVFSAHKFHGPRGVGILYIKDGRRIQPLIHGGGQESGARGGTENTPAIVAMAKALRQTLQQAPTTQQDLRHLSQELRDHLENKEAVSIFTPENHCAPHIMCFGIRGVRGEVVVHALEAEGIYVSTTSACSSRSGVSSSTLGAMGVDHDLATSAIRVSLSDQNTQEEMDRFIAVFDKIYSQFERIL